MAFPTIQFKGTNVTVVNTWKKLVEQKFKTLEKFLGSHTDATCHVEFEKMTTQQSGDINRVETTIFAHGKVFHAEAISSTFESAIDMLRKEIERELSKAHDKHETMLKQGRRKIKEMLRFGR